MAHWMNRIEIGDLHQRYEDGELTISDLGKQVAKRIRESKPYKQHKDFLEHCASRFERVKTVKGYDSVLEKLYDWGDTPLDSGWNGRKLCWIDTFATSS